MSSGSPAQRAGEGGGEGTLARDSPGRLERTPEGRRERAGSCP